MVYMGSKNKLSKYLKPLIEGFLKQGMIYVEPFVGGANMIDKIEWDHTYNLYARRREVKELLMIYEPKKRPNCWFWNHHR